MTNKPKTNLTSNISATRTKIIVLNSVIAISAFILMVIASFYDLQINHALSNGDAFIGVLFEWLGEVPAYIIAPIATTILYNCDFGDKKNTKIAIKIVFAILIFVSWLVFNMNGKDMGNSSYSTLINVFSAIILAIGSILISGLIDKEKMQKLAKWAIFAIIVMLLTTIIIQLMKLFWGRMRYRDMLAQGDFEGFTPWYVVNGHRKGDYTSFPSGHAASSVNILIFAVIADCVPRFKKYKPFLYLAFGVFIFLTMVSRIIFNAHFLSDVVVGSIISYTIFCITKKLYFKNGFHIKMKEKINE